MSVAGVMPHCLPTPPPLLITVAMTTAVSPTVTDRLDGSTAAVREGVASAPEPPLEVGAIDKSSAGTFTMNASSRLPPTLLVQMKYRPVMSRLPLGNFE